MKGARFIFTVCSLLLVATISSPAQLASGGSYSLIQQVVAGGGGDNSAGGSFSLAGTIGQSLAGGVSNGSPYEARGGYWQPQLGPTAAPGFISGRVTTRAGRGIINATVTLSDMNGNTRTTQTTTFGFFRFDDVPTGSAYVLTVTSKRFTFSNNTRFINLFESLADANFTADN
jgi:hypothetical protein